MSTQTKDIVEKVRALSGPLVAREGMELVEVEWLRDGGRWILRLYIDRPGGVTLDDCSGVSRQIDTLLEVEGAIEQAFSLEVSSPGVERPLRTREHFERFTGQQADVKTFGPIGDPPRKNYKGTILGVTPADEVEVEIDGKRYLVPLDKIAKAHLVFDFDSYMAEQRAARKPGKD